MYRYFKNIYHWKLIVLVGFVLITLAGLALLFSSQKAQAACGDAGVICIGTGYTPYPASGRMILDQNNTTYVLMQDVQSPTYGFEINGSNITLDGNSHSVTCNGCGNSGYGAWLRNGTGHTLKNLTVNWQTAIYVYGVLVQAPSSTVQNITVRGGMTLDNADNGTITDNTLEGLDIDNGSEGNQIERNTIRVENPPPREEGELEFRLVGFHGGNNNEFINNSVALIGHDPQGESFLMAMYNSYNNTLRDNTFSYPGDANNDQIKGWWIRDDSAYNLFENNSLITAHTGVEMQPGNQVGGLPPHHNTFRNNFLSGTWPLYITRGGARDNTFDHNTIISAGNGYGVYEGSTNSNQPNVFTNNTIIARGNSEALYFDNFTQNVSLRLRNNILYSVNNYAFEWGNYSPNELDSNYNVMFRQDGGFLIKSHQGELSLSSFQNTYQQDLSSFGEDPLFIDAINNDYRLQATSLAINAGDPDLDGDGMTWQTDADDQDPDGTRLDIGAYYYNQGGSQNNAPVLTPIGPKTINEGDVFSFTITATDDDPEDDLVFSASNLPLGASFVDNPDDTGTFAWIPSYTQANTYNNVHFEVTDGTDTDSENITVTVNNVNRAVVLTPIGDKTLNEGDVFSFGVTATDQDSDDTLTLSASGLPVGATFVDNGNRTGTFSWTPNTSQAGTYNNVHFEVTDGTVTDSEDITITVLDGLASCTPNWTCTDWSAC